MICARSEAHFRSSRGFIEGLDSEGPRNFQVSVKINCENMSAESGRFGGPFNGTIELVCVAHAFFAQLV